MAKDLSDLDNYRLLRKLRRSLSFPDYIPADDRKTAREIVALLFERLGFNDAFRQGMRDARRRKEF